MEGSSRLFGLLVAPVVLAACDGGDAAAPSPSGPTETVDRRRVEIYSTLIRQLVELRDVPIYVRSRLCENANDLGAPEGCTDRLTSEEQGAIAAALEGQHHIVFVSDLDQLESDLPASGGTDLTHEVVLLGPIEGDGDTVEVPGSHVCGGLCGGGSVWVLVRADRVWEVEGPAPGEGIWVA